MALDACRWVQGWRQLTEGYHHLPPHVPTHTHTQQTVGPPPPPTTTTILVHAPTARRRRGSKKRGRRSGPACLLCGQSEGQRAVDAAFHAEVAGGACVVDGWIHGRGIAASCQLGKGTPAHPPTNEHTRRPSPSSPPVAPSCPSTSPTLGTRRRLLC